MTSDETKELCLALLNADSEKEVVRLLTEYEFWDKKEYWRYYGDADDNWSAIGNQMSRPDAALVEKIVNSVDAVLMGKCWSSGLSPEDEKAPKTISEAVAEYFGEGKTASGKISTWSDPKRREVSRLISVAATGERAKASAANPSFTIVDQGEGQTPNSLPNTILSLHKKNKQKVHFVQGKFNMGGTGVLRFCSPHDNLQLVISRRNPNITSYKESDDSSEYWGFTVIRRENPPPTERSSFYSYLAPINAEKNPRKGQILRFLANTLPIFPVGNKPYARESEWGTVLKLYEYNAKGFKSHILMRDGLLSRLDILLPSIALPTRLHECRDYGGAQERSFETTLNGLMVRLEDDKAKNIETNFPHSSQLKVLGEQMTARIYAFKKGKEESYKKSEGLIFLVNGQTHAQISQTFFHKVQMGRIADSLLVIVDCTELSPRAREDMFMNSRDRLANCPLSDAMMDELETIIGDHQALRDLREQRRREEIETKLADSKPLQDTLEEIMKAYPVLASLFGLGAKLSNPFRTKDVASGETEFISKPHPTFFKLQKLKYGEILERTTAINMRARISFETDVANDYFDRLQNKGIFKLVLSSSTKNYKANDYVMNLENGKATLSIKLPEAASIGDKLNYEATVTDETLLFPFVNHFVITVGPSQTIQKGGHVNGKPPTDQEGHDREIASGLAMPNIHEISEDKWKEFKPELDKYSSLIIKQDGEIKTADGLLIPSYSFYVNVDNIYYRTEQKSSKLDPDIIKARFVYGLVLVAMALIKEKNKLILTNGNGQKEDTSQEDSIPFEVQISKICSAISPIILPLVESLGSLDESKVSMIKKGDVE